MSVKMKYQQLCDALVSRAIDENWSEGHLRDALARLDRMFIWELDHAAA